jgi:hypothetical protein
VRAPEGAGKGKAKVTFSFAAWKGGDVAPATVELPIDPERWGKSTDQR